MAAQCQECMSTLSHWDDPSSSTTELPLLGPRAMDVVERVRSGATNLKNHPDVADKLFVHFLYVMPAELIRGKTEDALEWIEETISKSS